MSTEQNYRAGNSYATSNERTDKKSRLTVNEKISPLIFEEIKELLTGLSSGVVVIIIDQSTIISQSYNQMTNSVNSEIIGNSNKTSLSYE